MTVLLSDIKTQIRQRVDMVGSGFLTEGELTSFANGSLSELYDIIVSRMEDQFINTLTFTLNSIQDGYTTPGSIYKVRGLDKSVSGVTDWYSVPKFIFSERNRLNNSLASNLWGGSVPMVAYDWIGNNIKLTPKANASGTYQLWYIPMFTPFVNDSSALDGSLEQWVEYIIVDCCIKALTKQQEDASVYIMAKQALIGRIQAMAAGRDAGMPERVTDVSSGFDGGFGWGNF